MTRSGCDMISLVEAQRDGRLDDAESATVARHLRTCRLCREHAEQLEILQKLAYEGAPEPLDEMSRRRRRLALLREASSSGAPEPVQRATKRHHVLMAAAALLTAILALVFSRSSPTLVARTIGATFAPAIDLPTSEPIRAVVAGGPQARFDRQTLRESSVTTELVRLYDGSVDVQVDSLGDQQRFLVAVGAAEVEVRGTRFTVVAAQEKLLHVSVEEGRVEVRVGRRVTLLDAGQEWTSPKSVATVESPPPAAPSGPLSSSPPAHDTPSRIGDEGSSDDVSAMGDERDVPEAEAVPAEPRSERAQSDASTSFEEALGELEEGDYRSASTSLRQFARDNPNDARAEDADYLAIVALQRAGRHAAAAQAARGYLVRYPTGARRAWARAIASRTKLDP